MHKIMAELHQDHIHLARLLKTLEQQADLLSTDADPDLDLILDIVDYIQNYPDLVHHPKEDMVYHAFQNISDDGGEIVKHLLEEHAQLPSITKDFRNLMEEVVNGGSIISRAGLQAKIRHFIHVERTHMNTEEFVLFPLIEDKMGMAEWQQLEEILPHKIDPLFGGNVVESYKSLYRSIEQQAA
ncbi:MAG: hemerythrin domain-containing protein [Thiolinea sp.]